MQCSVVQLTVVCCQCGGRLIVCRKSLNDDKCACVMEVVKQVNTCREGKNGQGKRVPVRLSGLS